MLFRVLVALALAAHASAYHFFPVPGEDVYGNPLIASANTKYQHIFAHANKNGGSFGRPWPPTEDAPTRATPFAPPHHQALVRPVIGNMSVERMRKDLEELTSFLTRHAKVQDGRDSQLWLLSQINDVADSYNVHGPLVTVFEFGHDAFPQRSIIARIHGSNITQDPGVVILGAHQDSKNYRHPAERSPGADDDGSGTVTILETFRALARVGYAPERTVEFHWYAAEEDGLLGSLDVVKAYKGLGKSIAAMNQYDMTAWVANGTDEAIGVVSSDVDIGLMALNVQLVNEYLDVPSVVFRFPKNAGSDHMGWYWDGYPAAFLTEGLFKNALPFVHTPDDRIDISPEFSFEHMHRFAQHAAAFAIEVAGGKHLNALL